MARKSSPARGGSTAEAEEQGLDEYRAALDEFVAGCTPQQERAWLAMAEQVAADEQAHHEYLASYRQSILHRWRELALSNLKGKVSVSASVQQTISRCLQLDRRRYETYQLLMAAKPRTREARRLGNAHDRAWRAAIQADLAAFSRQDVDSMLLATELWCILDYARTVNEPQLLRWIDGWINRWAWAVAGDREATKALESWRRKGPGEGGRATARLRRTEAEYHRRRAGEILAANPEQSCALIAETLARECNQAGRKCQASTIRTRHLRGLKTVH